MKYMVLLLILLAAAAPRVRAQAADEVNTLRLAQTYEQSGKYEEALRYYQDLFRIRSSNSSYFEGVRRNLTALKRYDEVAAFLTERIALTPNDFTLWVFRGGLRLQLGQSDSADVDWDRAVSINPNNAQVYTLIADQCINAREYIRAIDYLREGRKALRSPQMFAFEIARAAAMNMDFDAAMDEYLGYLSAAPQTLYQIQQQISMFSDIPEALDAAVRRARLQLDDSPDNEALRYLLAWLFMERKDYASAFEVYRELDKMKNASGTEIIKFAARAFNDKSYSIAAQAYAVAIDQHPGASFLPQAEFSRARCLEELYAEQGLPEAMQPSGEGTSFPSSEAVTSYQGAIALYEEISKKYPGLPLGNESLYRIAYIKFHRFDDTDGALEILRSIANTRRQVFGMADADVLIGDILIARGDLNGAIEQYDMVLPSPRLDPKLRSEAQFKIAEAYFFKGELDTVVVQLEPLTADAGSDIANDALDLAALIVQYRAPGEVPLQRYAQALFLERQRKITEAAAMAQDIISQYSSSDIVDLAYLKLAKLQHRSGHANDAAASYQTFLDARKESFLRDRGMFFLAQLREEDFGDAPGAIAMYQQMLTEFPLSQFAARARERILQLRKGNS
ncbi:MAG: tetratricopeptide repeat protein [Bacteroidota bacterium]